MLDDENKLYSIGAFSKLVGIPISSLRFYDEKGMLVPKKRDAASNYRYYSEIQVNDALTILQLKHLGMPLPDIKQFLECKNASELITLMEERLEQCQDDIARLEAKHHSTSQMYHQVGLGLALLNSQKACDSAEMPRHYEIRYLPASHVVARMARTDSFINDRIIKSTMELFKICEEENLQINGPFSTQFINHTAQRFESGKYETFLFYPIAPTKSTHSGVQMFGGFWVISTLSFGDYDLITPLYAELEEEIKRQNYKIIGDPIEEYLLNYTHIYNPSCFITRLSYPIEYTTPVS